METLNADEHAHASQALAAWDDAHARSASSWPILPSVMRLKAPGWPALWLPLIVLWPLLIATFCLALMLCALLPERRRAAFAALSATYQVLCALHGTQVELTDPEHGSWHISLY